jgi:hypothetical protein
MDLALLSSLAAIRPKAVLIPDKSVLTQDNRYNTEHAPEVVLCLRRGFLL